MSKLICVSYIPTCTVISLEKLADSTAEQVHVYFDSIELSLPYGCVWISRHGKICPVFTIVNAKIIYDNLMAWCNNRPEHWFYCGMANNDRSYNVGLFPNLSTSLERFKKNKEIFDVVDENIEILYHPLGYEFFDIEIFNSIKSKLPNVIDIGISESLDDVQKLNINWICGIKRSRPRHKIKYVEDYLHKCLI